MYPNNVKFAYENKFTDHRGGDRLVTRVICKERCTVFKPQSRGNVIIPIRHVAPFATLAQHIVVNNFVVADTSIR